MRSARKTMNGYIGTRLTCRNYEAEKTERNPASERRAYLGGPGNAHFISQSDNRREIMTIRNPLMGADGARWAFISGRDEWNRWVTDMPELIF